MSEQKRLDRPELREKIADYFSRKRCVTLEKARGTIGERQDYEDADQILALIEPLIEEAKKQERERIIKWIKDNGGQLWDEGSHEGWGWRIPEEFEQALRNNKEENIGKDKG